MTKFPALPKITAAHIMYSVAIANAFRLAWAYAYADADGRALSLPGTFGLVLGAAVSIGTAFVAGRIPATKGKRLILSWAGLVALLIMEPLILAPLTFTDMPAKLRANIPGGWGWSWSVILALVPSIVMVSIAFANGGLVGSATESLPSQPKPAKAKVEPKFICSCGFEAKSQSALNGHQKKHTKKGRLK